MHFLKKLKYITYLYKMNVINGLANVAMAPFNAIGSLFGLGDHIDEINNHLGIPQAMNQDEEHYYKSQEANEYENGGAYRIGGNGKGGSYEVGGNGRRKGGAYEIAGNGKGRKGGSYEVGGKSKVKANGRTKKGGAYDVGGAYNVGGAYDVGGSYEVGGNSKQRRMGFGDLI
jgi:hypothetical protein